MKQADSDAPVLSMVLPDLWHGGAQRIMLLLAKEFVGLGYRVDIVVLLAGGTLADKIPPGVGYRPLLAGRKFRASLALCGVFALARYLRIRRPDAVLSTMTGTNFASVLACWAARTGCRLVLRQAVSLSNIPNAWLRSMIKPLYSKADAVIAVSDGVREELVRLGLDPAKLHTVRNPVDAQALIERAAEEKPSELDSHRYIVNVGRICEQKDQATLLRAYAESGLAADYKLVLVGDGPKMHAWRELASELGLSDSVLWLGAMANPYPVMAAASLHVLASKWEGYPNVLLESLALGVPVVATDAPWGARELLSGGRYGALVPVGDVDAMADAMRLSLDRGVQNRNDSLLPEHLPGHIASMYARIIGGKRGAQ